MSELSVVRWCRPSSKSANQSGWRPAIVRPGRKWLHLVHFIDGGHVTASKIPASEARFFKPLTLKGEPYPLKRAARLYLRKKGHITKAAKAILKEARNG